MIVERILQAVLMLVALRTGVRLVARRTPARRTDGLEGELRTLPGQRFPLTAAVVTGLLVAGVVLEACWPDALDALRRDPSSHQWWRLLTSPFVQDGDIAGTVFNLASAALVLALAEWHWGRLLAAVTWLVGAWAPLGDLAGMVGYRVSAGDAVAYTAGSSGATYFTAATLCAALALTGSGGERLLGLAAPALGVALWLVAGDGHGVMFSQGVVFGALLWAARRIAPSFRSPSPARRG